MRILVVGAIQGGTVPICSALHRAFNDIGQSSDLLDFSTFQDEFIDSRNDAHRSCQFHMNIKILLLEKIAAFKPHAIFGIAQSPLHDADMLRGLKKAGIALCFWFMEDYQIFGYWKKIAPYFDHFFTIQKDPFWKELKEAGCDNHYYLPMAFDTHMELPAMPADKDIPVSFVGAPYPNRVHYFKEHLDDRFQIYGEGWDKYQNPQTVEGSRRILEQEVISIYGRSLVNINLHSSPYPYEFGGGDFVNPRTFELAGFGAFQLTDMRKLLTHHFDPASEVISLRNWDDMRMAVHYFLNHGAERQAYADRARTRVLKEHTYVHRAEEIISILNN